MMGLIRTAVARNMYDGRQTAACCEKLRHVERSRLPTKSQLSPARDGIDGEPTGVAFVREIDGGRHTPASAIRLAACSPPPPPSSPTRDDPSRVNLPCRRRRRRRRRRSCRRLPPPPVGSLINRRLMTPACDARPDVVDRPVHVAR